LKLSRYPRFFTATLAALPSMSLIPQLHSRAVTTGSGTEPSPAASVLSKLLLEPRAVGPEKVL